MTPVFSMELDDPNIKLWKALYAKDIFSIKQALENGANPNNRNELGNTILHEAVMRNFHQEFIHSLISIGIPLDTQNKYSCTPLMTALCNLNENLSRILLEAGADISIRNELDLHAWKFVEPYLPMTPCATTTLQDRIRELIESHDQAGKNVLPEIHKIDLLNLALFKAIRESALEEVRNLIEQGALANARDHSVKEKIHIGTSKSRNTALMIAAKNGNLEICELLLKSGALINAHNTQIKTALHCAAKNGNPSVIALLLKNGAKINAMAIPPIYVTPLIAAAKFKNHAAAQLLIESGADMHLIIKQDPRDKNGLWYAARNEDEKMCRLFIDHQAKLEKGLVIALCYIKKLGHQNTYLRVLYTERDKLLVPHLIEYYQAHSRKRLLTDHHEDKVYAAIPAEWLQPSIK